MLPVSTLSPSAGVFPLCLGLSALEFLDLSSWLRGLRLADLATYVSSESEGVRCYDAAQALLRAFGRAWDASCRDRDYPAVLRDRASAIWSGVDLEGDTLPCVVLFGEEQCRALLTAPDTVASQTFSQAAGVLLAHARALHTALALVVAEATVGGASTFRLVLSRSLSTAAELLGAVENIYTVYHSVPLVSDQPVVSSAPAVPPPPVSFSCTVSVSVAGYLAFAGVLSRFSMLSTVAGDGAPQAVMRFDLLRELLRALADGWLCADPDASRAQSREAAVLFGGVNQVDGRLSAYRDFGALECSLPMLLGGPPSLSLVQDYLADLSARCDEIHAGVSAALSSVDTSRDFRSRASACLAVIERLRSALSDASVGVRIRRFPV